MPTPFHHLVLAESVRRSASLPDSVRGEIERALPAFWLGHVAPDYVTTAGLPRAHSHAFDVPMLDRRPAHQAMLRRYPELADPRRLSLGQAVFLAGYWVHLWVDQAWIAYIFEPTFGPLVSRGTFEERLLDHNLLRASLDEDDLSQIRTGVDEELARAEPAGWLPFAKDGDLRLWRDALVAQLRPGARSSTVEVFASRHGLAPEDFAARLAAQRSGFRGESSVVSPGRLEAFRRLAFDRSLDLTRAYFEGELLEPGLWNESFPVIRREASAEALAR